MSEHPSELEAQIVELGLLDEPTRLALYRFVCEQPEAVSRDQAAAATGVSRSLAVFHLDRLADAGLLDIEYRRLSGRSGRGAGRPAKLYRRSARQFDLTLPPRRYALAAEILADALDQPAAAPARALLGDSARERGRAEGAALAAAERLGARAARGRRVEALRALLVRHGYEPYDDEGRWRVRNCPFHPLAAAHVQLVCGMNGHFVAGAAEALGLEPVIELDPLPGECCVVVSF